MIVVPMSTQSVRRAAEGLRVSIMGQARPGGEVPAPDPPNLWTSYVPPHGQTAQRPNFA